MIKRILLITYQNRSGSTLLLNLFSRDKRIVACLEAEALIDHLLSNPTESVGEHRNELIEILKKDKKLSEWQLPKEFFETIDQDETGFDVFLKILTKYTALENPDAETICFKGTKVFENYNLINELCFARSIRCDLIRIIRDPRAVYLSQKTTISPTTGKAMCNNPLDVARSWSLWLYATSQLNGVAEIKYEDLLSGGEQEFLSLCKKIELDFQVDYPLGRVFDRLNRVHQQIHSNLRLGLLRERINAWQHHVNNYSIRIIEGVCKIPMDQLGYTTTNPHVNPFWLSLLLRYYRVKSRFRFKKITLPNLG